MKHFILTSEQKATLEKIELEKGYELKPVILKSDEYAIPYDVLNNEGYSKAFDFLNRLPVRNLTDKDFPEVEEMK